MVDEGASGNEGEARSPDEQAGSDRVAELRAELRTHGLEAVDADELTELRRQAAGYQRLAALVTGPDDDPPGRS